MQRFELKDDPDYDPSETMLNMKMHKAISIIQFKIEGQIIKKNPDLSWNTEIFCI